MQTYATPEEAVADIASGERVFVHGAAMSPTPLLAALARRAHELTNVELVHLHTDGQAPHLGVDCAGHLHGRLAFVGANAREAVAAHRADYVPVLLSELPELLRRGTWPLDWALIQVSPPDRHGHCSLGTSVDAAVAACRVARRIIALVNPRVPRTHGDGSIAASRIDRAVAIDAPLHSVTPATTGEVERAIGRRIASVIPNGATLQLGIGAIPDAVLAELGGHSRLGVHTEMFSDGLVDLVRRGVVTGEDKAVMRGKIVTSFVFGTQKLYDFVDDNTHVAFREASYTNLTARICRNPKVVAINSAIEIDLTGQVCAESVGGRHLSGVGGQLDFLRGAALSPGGLPIVAIGSCARDGTSKIVARLRPDAAVTTTRAEVHWVVTEHGLVNLFGRSLGERARLLASIADPRHREGLERAARERFGP